MHKNKSNLVFCLMILPFLLSGCTRADETIAPDYWKAKLKRPSITNSAWEAESTEDIYDMLGVAGAEHESNDFITDLFTSFTNQLKTWGREGADSITQSNQSEQEVPATQTSIITDAASLSGKRVPVTFKKVVDGDTILVTYKEWLLRVRLIGIDTPESVHTDSTKNTPEGVEASNYLKALLEGTTTLWLEFDNDPEDDYRRTLAYVWLTAEGTDLETDLLNGILVKSGHAEIMTIEPNTKYADRLGKIKTCEKTNTPKE